MELLFRTPSDLSGVDLETQAVVVSSTGDDKDIAKIRGLTGSAVKHVIVKWDTFRSKGWIKNVVIPPKDLMENYATAMKDQVDAIAALHHSLLLATLANQPNVPTFSAPLVEKFTWWQTTTGVDRTTMLGWIHAGVNS